MNDSESHYILPYWFIQAVERDLLSSAIQKPLEILFPFSSHRDLKAYVDFIDCLQKYTRDFQNDNKFFIHEKHPTNFYLSHILTKQSSTDNFNLLPIFQEIETKLFDSETTFTHSFKIDFQSYELIQGCFSAYNALSRRIEKTHNLQDFVKHPPLVLSKNLLSEISNHNELILAIRLERLRQSNIHAKSFHLSIEELLSNIDFYIEDHSRGSWFQQAQNFLDIFLEKYKDFLKPMDLFFGDNSLNLENLDFRKEKDAFSICLQANPDKRFQKLLFEHHQIFSQNFIQDFFKQDLEKFIKRIAKSFVDNSYLDLEDFSSRMRQQISKVDAKCFLTCSDGYLLNLPLVFIEWYIRFCPTHPLSLPNELLENPLCHIFKSQTFESLESRFEAFLAACMADPKESLDIFETKLSCFASKASREDEDVIDFLNSEISFSDISKVSPRIALPTENLDTPTPIVTTPMEAVQAKENPSTGDYKLKKHVLEELEKIIQLDPDQYHEIKGSYFTSLNPDRRKMILEIQEKLGTEKFEEQLKPSLIKFMIENPTLWNQVRSKERILAPKSSFHSKPERLI